MQNQPLALLPTTPVHVSGLMACKPEPGYQVHLQPQGRRANTYIRRCLRPETWWRPTYRDDSSTRRPLRESLDRALFLTMLAGNTKRKRGKTSPALAAASWANAFEKQVANEQAFDAMADAEQTSWTSIHCPDVSARRIQSPTHAPQDEIEPVQCSTQSRRARMLQEPLQGCLADVTCVDGASRGR